MLSIFNMHPYTGVKHDVDIFCRLYGIKLLKSETERIWGIQKPPLPV